jgi:hypothetical protein
VDLLLDFSILENGAIVHLWWLVVVSPWREIALTREGSHLCIEHLWWGQT